LTDLAQHTGLNPSAVRAALWDLVRARVVTNDRYDVVRKGPAAFELPPADSTVPRRAWSSSRRRGLSQPAGGWSLVRWGQADPETRALRLARMLLQRYGVVARELALLDSGMIPWRVLYEVLSRMEMAGEVRRGYFVEGMSGAQFALPEAARMLQELDMPSE